MMTSCRRPTLPGFVGKAADNVSALCLMLGLLVAAMLSLLAIEVVAAPPSTRPAVGLRDKTPTTHALTGGRIVVAPGRVIEQGTLVIRDGMITAVGAEVTAPAGARVWDLSGKTIYPGLIDAYSEADIKQNKNDSSLQGASNGGAPYWNSNVRPERRVASLYQTDAELNESFRSQGITARLAAPAAGIIKGVSALVDTGDEQSRRSILREEVALHIRLTVSRSHDRTVYPNSPMGAVALARQALYDADWYVRVWQAYRGSRNLPRPEQNDALAALEPYLNSGGLVILDADDEQYHLRADRFAQEFGLNIAVRGSGREYRGLEAIRQSGRAILVPVHFPKAPNVATAEAAAGVELRQLMHWDIAPENPARLVEAGVTIALTSDRLKDKGKFLDAVRRAVRRGLSAEAALRALTTAPAEILGVADRLGTLEAGKLAHLLVTDGDLFEKKTKILETWIDGRRYELVSEPLVDLRGQWQLMLTGGEAESPKDIRELIVSLGGKPSKLSGTVRLAVDDTEDEAEKVKLQDVRLQGAELQGTGLAFRFDGKKIGADGIVRVSATMSMPTSAEVIWLGQVHWPAGGRSALQAKKIAEAEDDADVEDENDEDEADDDDDEEEDDEDEEAEKKDLPASFAVNFPLGAYGRDARPEQPELVAFVGGTVWTCDEQGVVEGATVLVREGKFVAVGKGIEVPDGARVIDATGLHITPGIIDCHSHMATDGGINESGQAITAEVRIGDFIDSTDITIYRQLAGGVTSSNILHGSANPIGGQNQVIKLRWGALPEEMKFREAPAGIKFALGENVKQSNWGDKFKTRYPQTRMGVEQIVRDALIAAREYRARQTAWAGRHEGLPPRYDLELEALAEIVEGERWIHCHSYRQDEILALLRTLEEFDIQIGTLQHILEGYKVADAMAKHGAMGSSFSDWWAYKFEVYDAIPYNGALMHNAGVVVSFNSDDWELGRHLNQEAAKAMKYGDVPAEEALKFVTLNPAKQLRIDSYVGSIAPGKHADLVVWSGPPLSNFSRCEQTWIDGRKYFDLIDETQHRKRVGQMRAALVQKILQSGQPMRKPGEEDPSERQLWPREDIFCHRHELPHE